MHSTNPARILVVDDMATNRELVRHAVDPDDYVIVEASTGEEALELLKSQSFDAVLLDIVMPGIGGLLTCKEIRSIPELELLPIIVLTSLDSPEDVANGMAMGATDYVGKPFNPVELNARLSAAVQHKRLTDRLDDTESVLFALARMVEARDDTTGEHCDRLSHMGVVFGKALGLPYQTPCISVN